MSDTRSFSGGLSAGLLLGLAAGAGLSLLYAPRRGKRTRYLIKEKINNIWAPALDRLDENPGDVNEMADKTQRFVKNVIENAESEGFSENNLGN